MMSLTVNSFNKDKIHILLFVFVLNIGSLGRIVSYTNRVIRFVWHIKTKTPVFISKKRRKLKEKLVVWRIGLIRNSTDITRTNTYAHHLTASSYQVTRRWL